MKPGKWCPSDANDAIALEFDQRLVWKNTLINQFYLDDAGEQVASGTVSGNVVTLQLKQRSAARTITYLKEMSWSQKNLLTGKNGIASLTFCNVPVKSRARADQAARTDGRQDVD